ncbi:glycosyltransferase family 4 protein [Algihabitans albus]|uniref:glycosyltransferase family 4 protein n=1 Tax=Algihabitans albus TaxID=2164067 RepID=UPI000E5D41A3|nr:glycosyltransferase family 4 protein [Algihabitans albus]
MTVHVQTTHADGSTGAIRNESGRPVVLQVLPALETGGVERGTVDIAGAIVQAGGTALVASAGGAMVHALQRTGARHIELPLASKNPITLRRNASRLASVIETFGVDLVHARSRAPAWSALWAARRTGRPFVTTFHAPYALNLPLKRLYNSVMARGARVICISDFVRQHVQRIYGIDPARLRLVHRGVDLEVFDPARVSPERVIQLAQRWRLPDGVPVILLPGRLTRWKGQIDLLRAAAKLTDLDFLLVLVGDDQGRAAYREELEQLVGRLNLDSKAMIAGPCNDMAAAYMLSDVVVSASTDPEGFGRVVGEAQAMGRPVVASDHGGAPEQLLVNETGLVYPPGDLDALAEALREALALDETARSALAERAIARVRTHFSKDAMCNGTLAVYREVLNDLEMQRIGTRG